MSKRKYTPTPEPTNLPLSQFRGPLLEALVSRLEQIQAVCPEASISLNTESRDLLIEALEDKRSKMIAQFTEKMANIVEQFPQDFIDEEVESILRRSFWGCE